MVGLTRPLELNGRQIVVRSFPVKGEEDTLILLITDVTDQRDLEFQLQHVRRMDAIGNLGAYIQYQGAQAMREAAQNQGAAGTGRVGDRGIRRGRVGHRGIDGTG